VVATPSFSSVYSEFAVARTNKKRRRGRKRVLGIIAGILVIRDLKTSEGLIETRSIPRTESIIAPAVQRAERIMRKIDNVCEA
jgi:hypothetical protein